MKALSNIFFLLLLSIFIISCNTAIKIAPGTVDAAIVKKVESQILEGPSILNMDGYFVWGGSVVKGRDNKFHMLFALWESGPELGTFVKTWVLESKIGYAVSDFPDRDFKFQKIVLQGRRYEGNEDAWDAQMVHNPHIREFNGKYYLYYIGSKDPGVQADDARAQNLDKRSRVQQSQCIGVIEFDNFADLLSGNFKRPEEPILRARTRVKPNNILNGSPVGTVAKPDNIIVVNPSVDFNPVSKKYMLFFKGNLYEPGWKGAHGVALGDSPMGPFVAKDEFIFDVRMDDGSIASTEDPYVWYSKKHKKFLAVVKDFSGRLTGQRKTLALLSSENGIDWELTRFPLFMNRELTLSDGTIVKVDRLERPQLLLDKKGIPTVMYAASSIENVNSKSDGSSYNVQIPLKITNE
jgi:hypothetical protein